MGLTQSMPQFKSLQNPSDANEHLCYIYYFIPGMLKASPDGIQPQYAIVNGWINRRPKPNEYVCDDPNWVGYVFTPKTMDIVSKKNTELVSLGANYAKDEYTTQSIYRDTRIEYMPPIDVTYNGEEYVMAQIQPPYEVEHYMDAAFWSNNYRAINATNKKQMKLTVCHVFGGDQHKDGSFAPIILPEEPVKIYAANNPKMSLPLQDHVNMNLALQQAGGLDPTGSNHKDKNNNLIIQSSTETPKDDNPDASSDAESSSSSSDSDKDNDVENKENQYKIQQVVKRDEGEDLFINIKTADGHALNQKFETANRCHFSTVMVINLQNPRDIALYKQYLQALYAFKIKNGVNVLIYAYNYAGVDGAMHVPPHELEQYADKLRENGDHSITFEYTSSAEIINEDVEKTLDSWLLRQVMVSYMTQPNGQ